MNITFNSKETYLAWRAGWRSVYREISKSIRQTKIEIKNRSRERQYVGDLQRELIELRGRAKELLDLRKKAKVLAQQQYQAGLQTRQAA
jgi:hypothetical protein